MEYAAKFVDDDNGTILVTFPDFPEAATFGDSEADARRHAVDALETAIEARIADRQDIPAPRPRRPAMRAIALPTRVALKVALYREMRARKMTKAKLARALGRHPPEIDRLLDIRHNSRLDLVDAAFAKMGLRVKTRILKNS
ncbi:MAG: type II toxin-antitoxin system HicB family antitoxin [Proteobacteria bacterium]|nr:type II toxin-antitoxin system HicB family antitoxin [Pseudomonadota bacterium]MCH8096882.1 type II toxin-antitoxin system HicB family antitoxin [Pseudomonadota bacterium]